jgi:hypothetical protein
MWFYLDENKESWHRIWAEKEYLRKNEKQNSVLWGKFKNWGKIRSQKTLILLYSMYRTLLIMPIHTAKQ